MYRTFSVAVSVAVMFLKKGSVERFCKTKIRTKFRDSPCESVYEFLHEFCVLHIFVVCAGQVHVRHDPISRIFLRHFISRSLQVSRPKLRKFSPHQRCTKRHWPVCQRSRYSTNQRTANVPKFSNLP